MPHKILIVIEDVGEDLLNTLYSSLKPEEAVKIRGVDITLLKVLNHSANKLVVSIEAQKLNVLRAALHSTLRLIKLTIDVIDSLSYEKSQNPLN